MNNFKAIVLAGGYGTRLRPLTVTTPKPLCTVCGESVLERLIRLMPEWDITDTAISTMYLSDKIREKIGNSKNGVQIKYVKEETPLGSAGGAKLAAKMLGTTSCENFIVLSGDGIFDFEIKKAKEFHINNDADVTIITFQSKEPLEYGVILSDEYGRIRAFSEKPSWSKVRSDTVNTGIYIIKSEIFNEIPDNRQFDFSKDLFPYLLGIGKSLYSYSAEGYWCDIGDISSYYKCNTDALVGKIKDVVHYDSISEIEAMQNGLNVTFPAYISKKAKISTKSKIGKHSIILDNCRVEDNCEIIGSILLENTTVFENSYIKDAIICENTVIGKNSRIHEGCTIGAGCTISPGATITEGISIWPQKQIEKGFCVTQDVIFENKCKGFYSDKGFYAGNIHGSINSDYIVRLGTAIGLAAVDINGKRKFPEHIRIGVMHDGKPESALIGETLLCGIKSTGCQSFSFLSGFDAISRFVASEYMSEVILFITEDNNERIIKAYDSLGMAVSRDFERKVEAYYKNTQNNAESIIFDTKYIDNIKYFYISNIIKTLGYEFNSDENNENGAILTGLLCHIQNQEKESSVNSILKSVLSELGADISCEYTDNAISISVDDDGMTAVLEERRENNLISLDNYHISALLISYGITNGISNVLLPEIASFTASQLLGSNSDRIRALLYEKKLSPQYITESRKIYDMCYAVPRLLCIMKKENKSISQLSKQLPAFEIRVRNISTDDTNGEHRASVMKKLCEKYGNKNETDDKDGITLSFSDGNITVIPRRTGGFKLISEAVSTEIADELCSNVFDEIKNLAKQDIE